MNNIRRGLLSSLLALTIISTFSIKAYSIEDNGNSGGGSQGGQSGSEFTWTEIQGGYRFTIVDKDLSQVSNTVDILYSSPNANFGYNFYTNGRAKQLSTSLTNYTYELWENIKNSGLIPGYPPLPVYYNGNTAQAGGEEFKQFFLAGKNVLGEIEIEPVYEPPTANNTNSNVNTSYGTSKPDKVDVVYKQTDMGYVSVFMVESSASYRASIRSESLSIVMEQGYYSHAREKINAMTNTIARTLRNQITHGAQYNKAVNKLISVSYSYALSNSYTTAEFNYMYSSILSEALGFSWQSKSTAKNNNSEIMVAYNNEVEKAQTLQTVPLASSSNKGYADKILNYKKNGQFIFKFTNGTSLVNNKIVDTIAYNGYNLIVEPVFWFKPAAESGGYPTYPVHSSYVYGTVANLIDFYDSNTRFGNSGGAYAPLTHSLGYAALYTSDTYGGIKGFTATSGRKTTSQIYNYIKSNYGIAMHLYKTTPKVGNDQVTGDASWETPAPPPDPSKLKEATGYTKEYSIVKYYEEVDSDGEKDYIGTYYGKANPHIISIRDELNYKVKGWFTTSYGIDDIIKHERYNSAYGSISRIRIGNSVSRIKLKEDTGKNEKTLVVLLQKQVSNGTSSGPLSLSQSQISKFVDTSNSSIYGKRTFRIYYDPKPEKSKSTDNRYSYVLVRYGLNNNIEADSKGGVFASKLTGYTRSGTVGIYGGTNTMSSTVLKTVLWRGVDIPTIASYKVARGDSSVSLTGLYSTEPQFDRLNNGTIQQELKIDYTLTGDTRTYGTSHWMSSSNTSYSGAVSIDTYIGKNKKEKGDNTPSGKIDTNIPFGNETSINSYGYSLPGINYLTFYPYIRMTYQDNTGTTNSTYPLSQWYSTMRPNRFVELGWKSKEETNVEISSTQWSLHARAIQGNDGWQGKNQVLPGGALYQLSISKPVQLALVTWEPILPDSIRNILYNAIPAKEYSKEEALSIHSNYVEQVENTVETYRIVQYANKNVKASNAWTGTSVKIDASGKSLKSIGLSGVTSSDNKYRLLPDNTGNEANQGDIDVVSKNQSERVYFKVFATPEGDIYLAKEVGDAGNINKVNGTNLSAQTGVTLTKILGPKDTLSNISKLTGDAFELEKRTSSVSNLLRVLERNTGNDKNASWNTSGHWYYEAFDGYLTVRQATTLSLGFKTPETRTSAIDTALVGKSTGTADMFTSAILSQFTIDTNGSDVVATVGGKEIKIPNLSDMFKSKKFYIPNVSVSDLKN